jgi:hypothetical protein
LGIGRVTADRCCLVDLDLGDSLDRRDHPDACLAAQLLELDAVALEIHVRGLELAGAAIEILRALLELARHLADARGGEHFARTALEVCAEPPRAIDDRELLGVRRDRGVIVAHALEELDPLVELAVAVRVGEDQHEDLGGGVMIDDRDRDLDHRAAFGPHHVEGVIGILGVQPLDQLGIRAGVDRRVDLRADHLAARTGDMESRRLGLADRSSIGSLRRRTRGPPGHEDRSYRYAVSTSRVS